MAGSYDRSKYRKGRIVTCKICGKEKYRSHSELKRNKTGNIYCSSECYQSTIKGEGNPNFNNHWTDELKEIQSGKLKAQFRNGRKPWCKGLTKEDDPRLAKCGVIGNDFGKYTKGGKRPDKSWWNVFYSAGLKYGLQKIHRYKYHAEFWLQLRNEVLKRDNYTCQKCGCRKTLIAHHIIPVRLDGKDELDNLISLCRECHGREEPESRASLVRNRCRKNG